MLSSIDLFGDFPKIRPLFCENLDLAMEHAACRVYPFPTAMLVLFSRDGDLLILSGFIPILFAA